MSCAATLRPVPARKLTTACPKSLRPVLGSLLRDLECACPAPPDGYEQWGALRYTFTMAVLQRALRPGMAVMDIASGPHFSYLVTRALPDITWLPTDVTDTQVVFTDRESGASLYTYKPRTLHLKAGPLALPTESPLDAITLFEVVEHLPWNPATLFGSCNVALREGGLCIISTPNITSRTALLRQLRGSVPYQTPLLEPGLWYHKREYAPWELKQLARWAGFEIVALETYNTALNDPRGWRAWCHHGAWLLGGAVAFEPIVLRNLLRYAGSNTFLVGRKVGPPKWDDAPPTV